jgi:Carboxypeptidase regulatory-like domain
MNRFAIALFIFLLTVSSLHSQGTASLVGTVTDQSGASVADAQVTVVNTATQFTRTVPTNANGEYVVSAIPTGAYVVTVAKPGFETLQRSGVQLTTASRLQVDLQLAVGSQTQTISVNATTPLLQSQSAEVSSLVDSRQMVALPLVSRDFTDLVLLTPGAHVGSASNLAEGGSPYAMRGGANYSVNGAVAAGNSYLVDGIYNRNLWLNTLIMVPVVDAIQEYRVMTSNYTAEYGESAGAVTEVATKSGTNEFHGVAWEFLRNDKLNANTFFNNRNGIARPGFRRNEFGATFGGPIVRNKTFFFGDYEGIRLTQPQTYTSTIPTLAQQQMVKTGNFSALGTTIYNPYSTVLQNGARVRVPFANNQIPANLLDPAAIRLFSLLPAPTSPRSTNNYVFNPALTQQTNQFDIRLDQNLGTSDRLFFRYSYDNSTQVAPGVIPSPTNACPYPHFSPGTATCCKPQHRSCKRCQPRHSVCQPGAPSPVRPSKPPRPATARQNWSAVIRSADPPRQRATASTNSGSMTWFAGVSGAGRATVRNCSRRTATIARKPNKARSPGALCRCRCSLAPPVFSAL